MMGRIDFAVKKIPSLRRPHGSQCLASWDDDQFAPRPYRPAFACGTLRSEPGPCPNDSASYFPRRDHRDESHLPAIWVVLSVSGDPGSAGRLRTTSAAARAPAAAVGDAGVAL